jgi:hypothetical protein
MSTFLVAAAAASDSERRDQVTRLIHSALLTRLEEFLDYLDSFEGYVPPSMPPMATILLNQSQTLQANVQNMEGISTQLAMLDYFEQGTRGNKSLGILQWPIWCGQVNLIYQVGERSPTTIWNTRDFSTLSPFVVFMTPIWHPRLLMEWSHTMANSPKRFYSAFALRYPSGPNPALGNSTHVATVWSDCKSQGTAAMRTFERRKREGDAAVLHFSPASDRRFLVGGRQAKEYARRMPSDILNLQNIVPNDFPASRMYCFWNQDVSSWQNDRFTDEEVDEFVARVLELLQTRRSNRISDR